jgi:AcrR family transcriptional regulator
VARPAEPGRTALLDAGCGLGDEQGLPGLSVNAVTARAGMAKGSFYQHFPDRRSYLVALHRRYHDQLEAVVLAAVAGLPTGLERIRVGLSAFLDACLRSAGTKALLVQARTDADLFSEVAARNAQFAALVVPDLAAIGWDPAEPVATLLVAMAADITYHELSAGGPRPQLRAALLALVDRSRRLS